MPKSNRYEQLVEKWAEEEGYEVLGYDFSYVFFERKEDGYRFPISYEKLAELIHT